MFTLLSVSKISVLCKNYIDDGLRSPAGNNATLWPYIDTKQDQEIPPAITELQYNATRMTATYCAEFDLDRQKQIVAGILGDITPKGIELFESLTHPGGILVQGHQMEALEGIFSQYK